jgi:dihydroorotate dehydrogenase
MMNAFERLARPLLFRVDPERAHELAIAALAHGGPALDHTAGLRVDDPRLRRTVFGLDFPNPIGLAAGFDKSARAVPAWGALGFGFAEVGTVTAVPQEGNPKPRIFRLPADGALVNRLGFNNDGADRVAERLARRALRADPHPVPIGVNIGKSRAAPAHAAPDDYARSADALWPYADYLVVNVSSPNTPGLRDLQEVEALERIVTAVARVAPKPLLVKLAPDLAPEAIDEAVDMALERGLAGVVVSNTTLAREGLRSPGRLAAQAGGLSGRPLRAKSTNLVRRVAERAAGRLAVVGVGGIFTADDVWEKLAAGADLVQVYTGFVYGGPRTAWRLNRGLLDRMARAGAGSLDEIPGRDGAPPR